MPADVWTIRLYLLRLGYLLTIVLVGANAWPALITHNYQDRVATHRNRFARR